MKYVNLHDICKPKQWKTISISQLSQSGFPVYGANGKIGFYKEYTHEKSTLMITCRGATCGNVHISEPFSYINGNAMALDELNDDVVLKYLYFYLQKRGFDDVITGSAQPQITGQALKKVKIPLPPLTTQIQIAKILDKSTALIAKRKAQIAELEALVQSVFLEMFGDPITNPKGWETRKISEVAPIKAASISILQEPVWLLNLDKVEANTGVVLEKEFCSFENIGSSTQAFTNENVLYCKLRPYLNKVVLPDEEGISTSELLPLKPDNLALTREFLACYLRGEYFVNWANSKATGAKMPRLSTTDLKEHLIILPTKSLQDKFSKIYQKIQTQKSQLQQSLVELETQHQVLMQRAFKGELVRE